MILLVVVANVLADNETNFSISWVSSDIWALLIQCRILKANLRTAIKEINQALLTTIGACGDVNRNVMCSSIPSLSKLHSEVYEASKNISNRLLPATSAYHEVDASFGNLLIIAEMASGWIREEF